jgi:hypothetical protein
MDGIMVTRQFVGICHMQLCGPADATDEQLLAVANRDNPSGTSLGWASVVRDGPSAPVLCSDDPTRRHYLAVC